VSGAARPLPEPSVLAIASLVCGVAGLVLAGLGSVGGRLGLLGPVVSYAGLVVAFGGTIVGTTLAALALLVTRGPGAVRSVARSRTWVGAAINLGLLLALVAVFARGVGRPLVVAADGGAGPDLEIRVHPAPDGSVVAIRPKGDADLAESRARIRAFSERLTRS